MGTEGVTGDESVFDMVVEIPKGSRNKYEIDHKTGTVWLDRHLFTATAYPADYGFIPGTLAEDGDPLDVLVLLDEPTVPGCHITARAIGVFWMRDEMGPDAKILSVPAGDPRWDAIEVLGDVPSHLRAEIGHFFEIYKALEPSKSTEVGSWGGKADAVAEITAARDRHDDQASG
jgi:inorganic pyrophosphatase